MSLQPNTCFCPACGETWQGFKLADHEGARRGAPARGPTGKVLATCLPCSRADLATEVALLERRRMALEE